MGKLLAGLTGLILLPLALVAAIGMLAISAATSAAAALLRPALPASAAALEDIPALQLDIYRQAASECQNLNWQILAGIAKVESNHGRYGGSVVLPNGTVSPPIIGIALDGTNNTARITDTDNGRLDGDRIWDRAVGPFQFIPTSWEIFGLDADGDGSADPNNYFDAAAAAVRHLCPRGRVLDIEAALFDYNRSTRYVADVLYWAEHYSAPSPTVTAGDYAFPVPGAYAGQASKTHHDYPAWDAAVPIDTPTFAITTGHVVTAHGTAGRYPTDPNRCGNTITIDGLDGAIYTYCHLSTVQVAVGQTVLAGTPIGTTGGQPGARGAGNTTGPHLHFSIRVNGRSVCPQPLLLGIIGGEPIHPTTLPRHGCTH